MDDLQRELGRLETQLAETTPDSRVIDELAAMRGELSRAAGDAPFQLANLRLASPCNQRWADMTGDERVRVCAGCERPVFNLSEMTRDQAETVLASRGIKPCVRFYRRADGTIMTADCAPGARRSHRLTVIAAGTLLGASSPAMAEPDEPAADAQPPTDEPAEGRPLTEADVGKDLTTVFGPSDLTIEMGVISMPEPAKRPTLEWSTWARIGYGIASRPPAFAARSTTPLMPESSALGEGALGIDLSLAVAHRGAIRVGAWAEARTVSGSVLGGELIVGGVPTHSYHPGSMGLVLRGGGNGHVVTGAFGFGYTTPDPYLGLAHASGIRMITSMTRSTDDPRDWSVTLGLELDPIGALGYIVHVARR